MKLQPLMRLERGTPVSRIYFSRSAPVFFALILAWLLPFAAARAQSLFVSSPEASDPGTQRGVERFNPATGAFEATFVLGVSAVGIAFGPTGDLFAASFNNGAVYRYDGTTGEFKAK